MNSSEASDWDAPGDDNTDESWLAKLRHGQNKGREAWQLTRGKRQLMLPPGPRDADALFDWPLRVAQTGGGRFFIDT